MKRLMRAALVALLATIMLAAICGLGLLAMDFVIEALIDLRLGPGPSFAVALSVLCFLVLFIAAYAEEKEK